MAPMAAPTYLTPEAYLELERKATTKNEYVNGKPFAMAGASFAYNFITFDTAIHLNNQLMDTECQVASTGDLRVKVAQTESYFYPDIVVVCSEPRAEDNVFDTLLNPNGYRQNFGHLEMSCHCYLTSVNYLYSRSTDASNLATAIK